jgi:chromosome segregation ATPase
MVEREARQEHNEDFQEHTGQVIDRFKQAQRNINDIIEHESRQIGKLSEIKDIEAFVRELNTIRDQITELLQKQPYNMSERISVISRERAKHEGWIRDHRASEARNAAQLQEERRQRGNIHDQYMETLPSIQGSSVGGAEASYHMSSALDAMGSTQMERAQLQAQFESAFDQEQQKQNNSAGMA